MIFNSKLPIRAVKVALIVDIAFALFIYLFGNGLIKLNENSAYRLMQVWALLHHVPERVIAFFVVHVFAASSSMHVPRMIIEDVIYYLLCFAYIAGIAHLLATAVLWICRVTHK